MGLRILALYVRTTVRAFERVRREFEDLLAFAAAVLAYPVAELVCWRPIPVVVALCERPLADVALAFLIAVAGRAENRLGRDRVRGWRVPPAVVADPDYGARIEIAGRLPELVEGLCRS